MTQLTPEERQHFLDQNRDSMLSELEKERRDNIAMEALRAILISSRAGLPEDFARLAYSVADAMIEASNQPPQLKE